MNAPHHFDSLRHLNQTGQVLINSFPRLVALLRALFGPLQPLQTNLPTNHQLRFEKSPVVVFEHPPTEEHVREHVRGDGPVTLILAAAGLLIQGKFSPPGERRLHDKHAIVVITEGQDCF